MNRLVLVGDSVRRNSERARERFSGDCIYNVSTTGEIAGRQMEGRDVGGSNTDRRPRREEQEKCVRVLWKHGIADGYSRLDWSHVRSCELQEE